MSGGRDGGHATDENAVMGAADASRADLARLRSEIERLDDRLVDLISERVRLARAAGAVKRAAGAPTMDPHREAEVVRHAAERARLAGLDDECVRGIFWRIIELSRRVQQERA